MKPTLLLCDFLRLLCDFLQLLCDFLQLLSDFLRYQPVKQFVGLKYKLRLSKNVAKYWPGSKVKEEFGGNRVCEIPRPLAHHLIRSPCRQLLLSRVICADSRNAGKSLPAWLPLLLFRTHLHACCKKIASSTVGADPRCVFDRGSLLFL
jgi:hypothetical protein